MNQIKIYSKQLVAEALSYMRNGEVNSLPVYDSGQFIGKITYQELMDFLNHKEKGGDIYAHKLNFDIGTAMAFIRKVNLDSENKRLERSSLSSQLFVGLSSVAVVALIMLGVTGMFFSDKAPSVTENKMIGNSDGKITLTLPNGKDIILNEAKTGLVIEDSKMSYSDGSQIGYQNLLANSTDVSRYAKIPINFSRLNNQMILNVPIGGMYRVILPDSSKVWLNAASRLKFPTTFKGAGRRVVELSGEAYFEIAKVTTKSKERVPFIVVTNSQEVEVLGTHFNVYAYGNEENVKTTLVEGSIRLRPSMELGKLPGTLDPSSLDPMHVEVGKKSYGNAVVLKPNEEATLTGADIVVKNVDADEAFAWTDGEYIFRNTTLKTVMHTITRWYDMEVIYSNKKASSILLGGAISRSSKIIDVLKMLELTANVHFEINGKKITVVE